MSRKLLSSLLGLLSVTSALALEPIKLSEPPMGPKYLVPVEPFGREYEKSILALLGERWGSGTMIYYDSTDDFVVSVWGKDYENDDHKYHLHNFVTLIEVSQTDAGAVAKSQLDVPIDVDFSVAVQRAWATMLLKTRYPIHRYLGVDGWQTEFSVAVQGAGDVYGQLWSPSEGLPKEFMDLGFALVDYCKTKESSRKEKRNKLVRRLKDFEDKVSRAGK